MTENNTRPIRLMRDILISASENMDKARRFYEHFLDVDAVPGPDGSWDLVWTENSVFRITKTPTKMETRYQKGRTPRTSFILDNIAEWVDAAVEAGATVLTRLRDGFHAAEDEPADYVVVEDPYGHHWHFLERSASEQKR